MRARSRGAGAAVGAAVVAALLTMTVVPVATGPAAAVSTDQSYWIPVGKRVLVQGHGYGHGHGMSQHGAQGAALQGLSYRQIAQFYYPGTTWGTVTGQVRVLISADTSDDVVVSPAAGLSVHDLGDGSTHRLPVSGAVTRWRLVVNDGRTVVQQLTDQWRRLREPWNTGTSGDAEFLAGGPITLWTPYGAKTYRGALRAASPSPGSTARATVNVVTMDQYVMGVVPYEMPASWRTEAVRAQAVAARTYATWSRDQNPRRYYQICDTTACQVYNGTGGEDARANAAVADTAGQILTYQGKAAFTQFSASSGGWTSAGSMPYLPAKQDPYDGWSGNSVHTWSTTVDVGVLERRYPAIGTLRTIRVTSRDGNGDWKGRVRELVLVGSAGSATTSGDSFRSAFGLRSSWFSIAPTPIITRWLRIGGPESVVGDVRGAEYAVAGGAGQRFVAGRIFHRPGTGAKELYGPILRTYTAFGGPTSRLGFPTTPVRAPRPHRLARFQQGSIYQKVSTTPRVVAGPIDTRYIATGGFQGGLGWPTSSNYAVEGGERVNFENGYIRWDRTRGTTRVVIP